MKRVICGLFLAFLSITIYAKQPVRPNIKYLINEVSKYAEDCGKFGGGNNDIACKVSAYNFDLLNQLGWCHLEGSHKSEINDWEKCSDVRQIEFLTNKDIEDVKQFYEMLRIARKQS